MKKLLLSLAAILFLMKPLYGLIGINEYMDIAIYVAISIIIVLVINEMMNAREKKYENAQSFVWDEPKDTGDESSFLVKLKHRIALTPNELVYVASEEDKALTSLLESNAEILEAWAQTIGMQIIYLPLLIKQLKEKRVFQYYAPYLNNAEIEEIGISNDFLLQYFSDTEDKKRVKQGFIQVANVHGTGNDNDKTFVRFYPLSAKGSESLPDQLDRISKQIAAEDSQKKLIGRSYDDWGDGVDVSDSPADSKFNSQQDGEDINDLMEEIRERVIKLRQRGIAEYLLEQLIHPDNRLSRMVITKDYRILLPDYNDMEIKMEPLVKAVYLLFLKHPEGIAFKCLPDYREELARVYTELRPGGLTDRALQSIEDVTNPLLNSINEKCARIRGAFVGQFDDYMARSYYIDGLRGEAKKISLPRELVVWEK